jgi:hypothetical protein
LLKAMKNLLSILFVSMLIMGISTRASFLKKLNKEISSKQMKSLAQSKWNLDYGPLFPNTNQWENPFEYADSTAQLDATSCDSIHWKSDPETDMECGVQDGVKKYCETIDKPFCHYLPDADNTGFGQCGTHSQVPYHTAKLIKNYSRFTMPKQCFCPHHDKQADADTQVQLNVEKLDKLLNSVLRLYHIVLTLQLMPIQLYIAKLPKMVMILPRIMPTLTMENTQLHATGGKQRLTRQLMSSIQEKIYMTLPLGEIDWLQFTEFKVLSAQVST